MTSTNKNMVSRRGFVRTTGVSVAGSMIISPALGNVLSNAKGKKKIALVGTGIRGITFWGKFLNEEYSDVVEINIDVPGEFSLNQNYPNPFNPSTKITFSLASDAKVTLKIFDVLGREVMTIINQDLTAGAHTYDFDATGLNSGAYFYKLEANGKGGNNFSSAKKMIILK